MSPLPTAYLTRIGPIPERNGVARAIYLAIGADGERLATRTESPPDDAAALRGLAATLATHAPRCALELAEIGASLGLDVGELPPRAAEERAVAAYLAYAPDHLQIGPGAFRELCKAAADYQRAHPWTKLAILQRFRVKETIRIASNGNVLREGELLLQVHAGNAPEGPRLHVEIEEDSWGGRRLAGSPFRVEVTLASEPRWVADAVDDAYGAYLCPQIAHVDHETLGTPNGSHALLAAAAMRAAVDRMQGGAGRGRASDGLFHFELEVDFARSVPPAPFPTRDGAFDLRVLGRLMARTLATQVPLPYYDDVVCVVLERDDSRTERAMHLLDEAVAIISRALPAGFEAAYKTAITAEDLIARWMPTRAMLEMLRNNHLPPEHLEALRAALPPSALRVLLFGSHRCESFFVDFAPRREPARRERVRDQASLEKTGGAETDDAADDRAGGEPRAVEGTWRDGRTYLPPVLPGDWTVGERGANGAVTIAAGPLSVVLAPEREDRRRWVKLYFGEHPEGRPVTLDEARSVYEKLVGCARFTEMTLVAKDAARVSLVGARLFAAPLKKVRPHSVARPARTEREETALIERAKVHLAEVIARVRDGGGQMRDHCVILEAKPSRVGADGVFMTRSQIERVFATPESDRFHIRARFEEPRPPDECVVFVKHADGIEEMHISVEGVEMVPEMEA